MEGSRVVIVAPHGYAFLPLPGAVKPDLVVMDEAPEYRVRKRSYLIMKHCLNRSHFGPGAVGEIKGRASHGTG
jgi:hypothetical protein